MNHAAEATLAEQARDCAARGEWERAYRLLAEADASERLAGDDLVLLAHLAYAAGHLDATIDTWERAHAESLSAGDRLAAAGAAVRVALHLLFDTALMAPVRGWMARAERLLQGHAETSAHAWLAVVHSYERLLSGDFESAQYWARQAIDIGTDCEPAAAAVGRVAEARSLILCGDVGAGLKLLEEAGVVALSRELDPISRGIVFCELVCAFQGLALYDLAEEWTAAMERWHRDQPVGSIHGRCRVHRAEILRLRGAHEEAEREALVACEELRPYLRREFGWPLTELGRIRLRRGDLQGAEEAFRSAHDAGWDPQPGLALVHLARGDGALAVSSIRDALGYPLNVPSKELPPNTELRRAPLLDAQVEIEVAAGDLDRAREAAAELGRIAGAFKSNALAAAAALACGRVRLASGEATAACEDFEDAARRWSGVGAPYEIALARMGLGDAYHAYGDEERALLEFRAASAGFERTGATSLAARAAQACEGPIEVSRRAKAPELADSTSIRAEYVFRREGDFWTLMFEGQTVRLRDRKGLRYLARLLANPGHELHVLELVRAEHGAQAHRRRLVEHGLSLSAPMDAGVLLDGQAKEAYRRRLAEIEEDIEEAHARQDLERAIQAEAEREFLVRELARAVGLGGRDRRAGSSSERARASVTRAIRDALTRIREHHVPLANHLDRAVRTGTYCAYLPDTRLPANWSL